MWLRLIALLVLLSQSSCYMYDNGKASDDQMAILLMFLGWVSFAGMTKEGAGFFFIAVALIIVG